MAGGNLDLTTPLATWLATAVGNGTYADVISTLKIDEPGKTADATDIETHGGQLWANLIDDLLLKVYELNPGAQVVSAQTTNATPLAAVSLCTMAALGETWRFEGIATAVDTSNNTDRASCRWSATVIRTAAATFTILDPISTVVDSGMPGMACAIAQVGATEEIALYVTGIAATTIDWEIVVKRAEQVV